MRTCFSTGTHHDPYTQSASCNSLLCWCDLGSNKLRWPCPSVQTTSLSRHFGLVTENLIPWFYQPIKKITLRFTLHIQHWAPRGPPTAHSPHWEPSSVPALCDQRATSLPRLVHFIRMKYTCSEWRGFFLCIHSNYRSNWLVFAAILIPVS